MKKYFLIILVLFLFNILHSLGTLRVESIKELPETHMNLEIRDADGKFAPVLIVKTELKGLGIQNIGRPTKHAPEYIIGDHHYKFYMNDNQRVVKITHAEYEPLEVRLLADFGINVKAQRVYELILTNKPGKEFINVVIISDPDDATKIIDGKNVGTGQSFELFIGKHSLELQKNGFKSITKDIEVSKSKTLFNNLVLPEVEPVMITIKSEPDDADIYINNVKEGKTNKQLFKFPDSYELRLVKDKYDTIDETITISESGNNIFEYNLPKNTSILTINTTPSNCDIYINNEKLTSTSKEVSAGKYRLEIKKEGYFPETRTIDVIKGNDKTVSFDLEQKTGKLQFTVEPMEANVILKKDNRAVDNWIGSKYKTGLLVGEYEIIANLSGYRNATPKCTIRLDEITEVNIVLKKGQTNLTVTDIDSNVYQTLIIGDQEWMAENLKVTHYRNGDPIPHLTDNGDWTSTSSGAYCVYDNTPSNADTYGNLYHWYAVDDSRNIAPEGWHVPTDEEIKELEMYLGMSQSQADDTGYRGSNEGSKLAGNTALWDDGALENDPEFGSSGFSFLPGGYRGSYDGGFYYLGGHGYFWSATEFSTYYAWRRYLSYSGTQVYRYSYGKRSGFSVRCVRD